jgi:hypothetical protein
VHARPTCAKLLTGVGRALEVYNATWKKRLDCCAGVAPWERASYLSVNDSVHNVPVPLVIDTAEAVLKFYAARCSMFFIYLKHIFEFATCLYKISNFELEPCVTLEFDLRCFIRKKNIHHKILCRGLYLDSWVCCTPSPHRQHTCSLVFKFLLSLTFYAMFESLYYWKY